MGDIWKRCSIAHPQESDNNMSILIMCILHNGNILTMYEFVDFLSEAVIYANEYQKRENMIKS